MFWSIFVEIDRKPFFVSKKWHSQKIFKKYSWSFFPQQVWKGANPVEIQHFLFKPVKWGNYYKKLFSPKNEPHTAMLSFSWILKHFRGNWLKTSLLGQKWYLRKKLRFAKKFIWENPLENLHLMETICQTTVKREKY